MPIAFFLADGFTTDRLMHNPVPLPRGTPPAPYPTGALLVVFVVLTVVPLAAWGLAHRRRTRRAARGPAGWAVDPTGRHQLRYRDGSGWTEHVADAAGQSTDPVA